MLFRRRKIEEDDLGEEKSKKKAKKDEDELVWDKKRILIGLGIIILISIAALELKGRFFPDTNILGESTTISRDSLEKPDVDSPNLNLQSKINTSLDDIRGNVENLDPEEIASSSPQIQKVLRDIQGIRNLPIEKARDACFSICSGI